MKKIFTFILALIAGAGTLFAESGTCGNNLTWNYSDGVLTISGFGAMYDYQETTHNPYTTHKSTTAPWANHTNEIKSIVITNSVTSIGSWAFYYLDQVTSVTIGRNVQSIGTCAFENCKKISNPIVFPNNLKRIGWEAFCGCSKMPSVTLNDKLKYIGCSAFFGCDSIKSVVIPDNVDTIELKAFDRCDNLKSVTIGENVKYIAYNAFHEIGVFMAESIVWKVKNYRNSRNPFEGASYVKSFVFGENVEYIPAELCAGMDMSSITIPESVTSIGKDAFKNCSYLKTVVWNARACADNTLADNAPFYTIRQQITSLVIGDKVTFIPSYLCYEMNKLPKVEIPASVTSIGNHAFDGCSKWAAQDVVIPNDVTSVGEYAFANCDLATITIGSKVNSIGKYAFMGSDNVTAVYNEAETPQSITANVFGDLDKSACDLYVPEASISSYRAATVWKDFGSFNSICRLGSGTTGNLKWNLSCSGKLSITGTGSMPDYSTYESSTLCTAPWYGNSKPNRTVKSAEISDGITRVGNYAFWQCQDMTDVYIPNTVTSIGEYAFYYNKALKAVTLSDNIESIGQQAFTQCTSLTSLTLPIHLKNIESTAFALCSGLTSVVIPNEVEAIREEAFAYCTKLEQLTIPASVTTIEARAFTGCTKLAAIRNDAMTPQTINANVFGNVDKSNCTLIVPKNAVSAYLNAPVWKEFNILTEENVIASGICGAQGDNLTWTLTTDGLLTISGTGEMGWAVVGQAPWDTWKNSILSVVIGNGVTSIASFAFLQCEALSQIEIPSTVTTIADGAFTQCYGLSEITIPANVTNIGHYTFLQCSSLTSITIPEGITNIGTCAFQDCTSLTSITIPASVETIGVSAFANCSGLKSVTNKRQVPQTIEASVFGNLDLSKIYLFVEPDVVDDYKAAAVWKDFNPIVPIGTPMSINEITNDNYQISNKVIRDGHLYIIRDGKTYSVTGQMVK